MKNHIRHLRGRQALTQRQLAERVGTSQQQIQRIEAGVQVARIDLAQGIATALDRPIAEVFPGYRTLKRSPGSEPPTATQVEEAGVELDASLHRFVANFEGGPTPEFILTGVEKDRVRDLLLRGDRRFLVFDSLGSRWAVNTQRLRFAQILFDPGVVVEREETKKEFKVATWFDGDIDEPSAEFLVDPDERFGDEVGNVEDVFASLELRADDDDYPVHFTDQDGEDVILYPNRLVMLSCPLSVLSPELLQAEIEGDEEDGVTVL